MLSREEAKIRIEEHLENQEPIRTGQKLPIRLGQTFNVYKIPLKYLAPNLLNDRIAWKIREFEAENNRKLSYDNEEDINLVYKLLEDEHKYENEKTLKDLAIKKQQVYGIITNEGIIIDGNRRATLLRKLFNGEANRFNQSLEEFRDFEAIVLKEDISPEEIMALETSIQIGEDIKVSYNPINIYIKIDNLIKAGYNTERISGYMGIPEDDIKERIERFKLMNEYLKSIGKPDHFTLLDGLEDHFIRANKVFKRMDNKSYRVDWDYKDSDVANFKELAFDYMRAKYEGKEFRDTLLGGSNKGDGVFLDEDIWKNFYNKHMEIIDGATLEKEEDWKLLQSQLKGNLRNCNRQLDNMKDDKSISSIISAITTKVGRIESLLKEKNEIDSKSIKELKELESRIYKIRKEFE